MHEKVSKLKGWHVVWKHMQPYKKEITLLSVLGVVSAGANGLVPFMVGRFFDSLLIPMDLNLPNLVGIPLWAAVLTAWIGVQFMANLVDWVIDRKSRFISTRVHMGYQAGAFAQLLMLPLSFHKTHKSGEITDLINKASWQLESIVGQVIINLTPQFLSILVGIAIAFTLYPMLAMVLVGGLLLYLLMLVFILRPVSAYHEKAYKAWGDAYADANDTYINVQAVKHATAEEQERKRIFNSYYGIAAPLWYKVELIWSNVNFYQRIIVVATQLAVFILSASLVFTGELTIGGLIAFNSYAALIFGPFVALGYQWQSLQNGLVALARGDLIFSTPTEPYEPKNPVKLGELDGNVTFDDVRFAYGEGQQEILKGISFEVKAGQIAALVGETGVGKSTLADLISGYYFATSGTVAIDGNDIRKVRLPELREQIAIVPQEVVLFNNTILENIRYGRKDATDADVREAARKAHADMFIEKFPEKYNQMVGERGIKLSVGQKQRMAIARAILRDPTILVLDEPTSALDVQTEAYITESLEKLMEGRTTFIIAHRLSTVRKADVILVFKEGKVIEKGTHDQLLALNGEYKKLHDLHIGLH